MLEEDGTAVCGPRYAHLAERQASRAGAVSSEVVLGARKVAVRRPRVRADGREVPLPTFQAMADVDPLNRRVVEQMLVGVATRRYPRSLEPVPATMRSRGANRHRAPAGTRGRRLLLGRQLDGDRRHAHRRLHLDAEAETWRAAGTLSARAAAEDGDDHRPDVPQAAPQGGRSRLCEAQSHR